MRLLFLFLATGFSHFLAAQRCTDLKCPIGYQQTTTKFRRSPFICVQYVRTALEFKCLRGIVNNQGKCETFNQRPAEISCPYPGFVRTGFVCSYPIQLDSLAPFSVLANMACSPGERLDEATGTCIIPRLWPRIPVCAGEISNNNSNDPVSEKS